ncbi:unnamed protein product, partial [Prorocentrum cordatum]
VLQAEVWPVAWTGGRLQEVFKQKGSRANCDDYRGIILEDHLGKGLKQHLSQHVFPQYAAHQPDAQHGAVGGRSTDFASHLVVEILAYAARTSMCVFIMFLDLVKAFDRVIREITLGWPAGVSDGEAYLMGLGLGRDQAQWIAAFVSVHGPLLEKWGVSPKVIRLLKNMHVQSWFSVGDLDTAIAVRLGGRQGCKYGACLFNSTFSVALQMIHDLVVDAGFALQLPCDSAPVWAKSRPADGVPMQDVVDVAFVDDTVLMLLAVSAKVLDRSIDGLLGFVLRFYRVLNLEINFQLGKTEAFLKYRGHGAVKHTRARRRAPGGPLCIQLPSTDDVLHVVPLYKHLGCELALSGSLIPLGQSRRKKALAAYAPLAMKLFGSQQVDYSLKCWMFTTLVMSRLLFNLHIFVPTAPFLSLLNDVYMRGYRRMLGAPRFGPGAGSDLSFRSVHRIPSIDCVLARARLTYLGRLVRARPPSLSAVLRQRPERNGMPQLSAWLQLVIQDQRRLHQSVALCSNLPDPAEDPEAWCKLICDEPLKWKQFVALLHF